LRLSSITTDRAGNIQTFVFFPPAIQLLNGDVGDLEALILNLIKFVHEVNLPDYKATPLTYNIHIEPTL
jgi:hypothetical protein